MRLADKHGALARVNLNPHELPKNEGRASPGCGVATHERSVCAGRSDETNSPPLDDKLDLSLEQGKGIIAKNGTTPALQNGAIGLTQSKAVKVITRCYKLGGDPVGLAACCQNHLEQCHKRS